MSQELSFFLAVTHTTNTWALWVGDCRHAVRLCGHRLCCNLWPLLPGQRLGASAAPALSSTLQAVAFGLHCLLGAH